MREIIFRGKTLDKGEWVYGVPVVAKDNIADKDITVMVDNPNEIVPREGLPLFEQVDSETVGQYTGLRDKNGERIFEGDIVRYTFDSPDDPTATENGLKVRVGRVFWSDWRATFAVTAGRRGSAALNNDVSRYVRGRSIYEYVQGANTVEVIGNIHDNPELLEGGTQ